MGKQIIYDTSLMNYVDESGKRITSLCNLKRINLLVGENNSGKSRFMRSLINGDSKNNCRLLFHGSISSESITYVESLVQKVIEAVRLYYFSEYKIIKEMCKDLSIEESIVYLYKRYFSELANMNKCDEIENYFRYIFDYLKIKVNECSLFYIPVLRGIENFEVYFEGKERLNNIQMTLDDMDRLNSYVGQAKSIYKNKVRKIYNILDKKIFTAENLYEDVVDILLGDENRRETFHAFEKFISDNFYDGEGFSINPNQNNKCLMVKIKDDPERKIYDLGDGIKQLIVLLYQIYMNKDEEYLFFIEEPEINLHPGFQRKFMEILLSDEFSKHLYFINTHSNHIIDIINENDNIKIYKFKKNKDKKEIIEVKNDYVSLLNELGIRSSSIFLSNCTIWVEGISDRIYLKKYLEVYFKYQKLENIYKENIHYSFVEYGGGNLPHWNFSDNISNTDIDVKWLSHNTFLIVDNNDTQSSPTGAKHQRKIYLKEILGDNFYEHKSREMENIIKLDILEKMLMKDNGLTEIKRLKYNTPRYKYTQSVLSNPNMQIGYFIEETYELNKKYRASSGGTIRAKADFANKICDEIHDWDDLSEEAQELTTKVAEFIMKNNE